MGPSISVDFRVMLDGYYSVEVTARLCLISMVASAKVVPSAGLTITFNCTF